ncbi:MAG: nucleoside-diphosphate kinase [Candidatus Poribacteria bacterium]|nr:nucleoside-diphosphate kinase [Candidatus Poribacteria bacterium]
MERTLVLLKPDAVQRGLVGEIVGRFERKGLKIVGMKFFKVPDDQAKRHYAIHEQKPFFGELIEFITSSPIVALALEGKSVITRVRTLVGATNPDNAAPGTIRADLGNDFTINLIHASDAPETAASELALWFAPEELVDYVRCDATWLGIE